MANNHDYNNRLFIFVANQTTGNSFQKKLDYLTISSLALFIFAFSFGTVIHINCYYDNSVAHHYTAKVLDKRISSGKSTSYYLELSTWGQQKETDEASVEKQLYNRLKVGDQVNIYFRNGKLKIPWFVVTDERKKAAK